jgi:hypothetical protein
MRPTITGNVKTSCDYTGINRGLAKTTTEKNEGCKGLETPVFETRKP